MTITAQEAGQMLQQPVAAGQQMPQAGPPGQAPAPAAQISPQEAGQMLQQPVTQGPQAGEAPQAVPTSKEEPISDAELVPTGEKHLDNLRQAIKEGISSASLGLGVGQGLANMGYGLASLGTGGINALTKKLFGKDFHLRAGRPDVFLGPFEHSKETLQAEIGEYGIAPIAGGVAGLESLIGKAGIIPKMATYGATAAATTPGGPAQRIMGGAAAAGGIGVAHLLSALPNAFVGRLADKLQRLEPQMKSIGKDLYNEAFKGTEKITSTLSTETQQSLDRLMELWKSKAGRAPQAIARYEETPTLKNVHLLRSDLRDIESDLKYKASKSGLSSSDGDKKKALGIAADNLNADLEVNMATKGSPAQYNKFLLAQQHWRDSVVPFRKFKSLRDLLGPEEEITPRLYKDLTRTATSARKLRTLLNTNLGSMQLSRILRSRLAKYALPAYLALHGGYALYHHANLGEQ